jgi:hypothetical protein
MSDLHPDLVSAVAEGRCVLFVGSGLSKHTHELPTWLDFIKRVRKTLSQSHGEAAGANEKNVNRYPLEYLQYAKEYYAVQYQDAVQQELHVPPGTTVPRAHELIAALPWAAVITTNLDNLLEYALEREQRKVVTVEAEEDLSKVGLSPGALLLLKMHGQ